MKLLALMFICLGAFAQEAGIVAQSDSGSWVVFKYVDKDAICYVAASSTNRTMPPTISCIPNIALPAPPPAQDVQHDVDPGIAYGKQFEFDVRSDGSLEGHLGKLRKE